MNAILTYIGSEPKEPRFIGLNNLDHLFRKGLIIAKFSFFNLTQ